MSPTQAIIYVPGTHETIRWLDQCVRYCTDVDYVVAAIVMDDQDGKRWPDVLAMVVDYFAEVIVVARTDHLPPGRPGRIEIVSEQTGRPGQRRPRLRGGEDR